MSGRPIKLAGGWQSRELARLIFHSTQSGNRSLARAVLGACPVSQLSELVNELEDYYFTVRVNKKIAEALSRLKRKRG